MATENFLNAEKSKRKNVKTKHDTTAKKEVVTTWKSGDPAVLMIAIPNPQLLDSREGENLHPQEIPGKKIIYTIMFPEEKKAINTTRRFQIDKKDR